MLGVFAEFERRMIVERVKAGLTRAQASRACGPTRIRSRRGSGGRGAGERRVAGQILPHSHLTLGSHLSYRAMDTSTTLQ